MREAPSLVLIEKLVAAGAKIRAHDPVATETAKRELPEEWLNDGHVTFFEHQYDVLDGADALILVTEWKPFRNPDFERIKGALAKPVIFDGRNQYDPTHMSELGIEYFGIGRGLVGG